ncbi:TRAP transporter substrate-binding protein [Marinimicrobium sp. ABcell2]|nr:TRAP transporter substrate-binding protein [Marinimicrobium sp. ABcell2]MDQ2076039.1 TRAP transporter substrate-binding protein [Marinimicrobium sp. ABcell2]
MGVAAYLALLLAFTGCGQQSDVVVLKMGHDLDRSTPVHLAMEYMGARLEELSDGTMRVDVYSNGQLGAERELIELLQIGSLAMTKVSAGPMESFVPRMQIFSIPYVFRDHDHFWQVLDSDIGRDLLVAGEAMRLRGLGYYDAGSRSFYTTRRPVYSPEDLAGQRIRVMESQTAMRMVRALGGSPTPISWGELYTALSQGVVDGAENNPPSFYISKHYEVSNYFTLDEHTYVPDVVLISSYIWNNLTEQQQTWLQQAMDESVEYQKQLWAEATEHALRAVEEHGVEIIYPDKSEFMDKVADMHESYRGEPVYELLQRIQAMD